MGLVKLKGIIAVHQVVLLAGKGGGDDCIATCVCIAVKHIVG